MDAKIQKKLETSQGIAILFYCAINHDIFWNLGDEEYEAISEVANLQSELLAESISLIENQEK